MNERIDGGRGDISVAVGAVMRICPVRCFGILLFYLFFLVHFSSYCYPVCLFLF